MSDTVIQEVIDLNAKLLHAIAHGDWTTYAELCDPSLTAFEPEALGQLVHGLDFHHFYFRHATGQAKPQNTMSAPHVRLMGDTAILCYYRLTQVMDANGGASTRGTEETRVWQRQNGRWRHVHFHRSPSRTS
jgi:ketosteroid isomerase-like protein